MMKHVVVIMLVLACAAVGGATVVMTLPTLSEVGRPETVWISSDQGNVAFGGYIVVTDVAAGMFSDPETLRPAGDTAFWEDLTADRPGWWFFATSTSNPDLLPINPGDWFTIDYTALDDYSLVTIDLYDLDENLIGTSDIQNPAEPMTLGLLGLGGLLLRRRRRSQIAHP